MTQLSKPTLSQVFNRQADIIQPILADYSHLSVTHLNYFYADWQQQRVSLIGTEALWLQHCQEQGLLEDLPTRLHGLVNLWEPGVTWYQVYQGYRMQQGLSINFLKTDICLAGQHGFHLLEIAHDRPLSLFDINPLFDCISRLKDESRRLQQHYSELVIPIGMPITVPSPIKLETSSMFDVNQIEEADPIALNELETKVLTLRLQGYQDDEIADPLQLSLADIRQLFVSIADKHQHPRIPTSVYRDHFANAFTASSYRQLSISHEKE
ncbi:MAG: hypothetical protein ISP86_05110 [Shewanellaceae bacterium]|nr:hypothetical protein [Shewanellaceae bacterium]